MTGAESVFLIGAIAAFAFFAAIVGWVDHTTSDTRARWE